MAMQSFCNNSETFIFNFVFKFYKTVSKKYPHQCTSLKHSNESIENPRFRHIAQKTMRKTQFNLHSIHNKFDIICVTDEINSWLILGAIKHKRLYCTSFQFWQLIMTYVTN
jgi:hypothetical protein